MMQVNPFPSFSARLDAVRTRVQQSNSENRFSGRVESVNTLLTYARANREQVPTASLTAAVRAIGDLLTGLERELEQVPATPRRSGEGAGHPHASAEMVQDDRASDSGPPSPSSARDGEEGRFNYRSRSVRGSGYVSPGTPTDHSRRGSVAPDSRRLSFSEMLMNFPAGMSGFPDESLPGSAQRSPALTSRGGGGGGGGGAGLPPLTLGDPPPLDLESVARALNDLREAAALLPPKQGQIAGKIRGAHEALSKALDGKARGPGQGSVASSSSHSGASAASASSQAASSSAEDAVPTAERPSSPHSPASPAEAAPETPAASAVSASESGSAPAR